MVFAVKLFGRQLSFGDLQREMLPLRVEVMNLSGLRHHDATYSGFSNMPSIAGGPSSPSARVRGQSLTQHGVQYPESSVLISKGPLQQF